MTGKDIKVIDGERREGYLAVLIADASLIKSILGWVPAFDDLYATVSHSWNGEKKGMSDSIVKYTNQDLTAFTKAEPLSIQVLSHD